jgi:hypothetical protein
MPSFPEMFRAMHYSPGLNVARATYNGVEILVGNDGVPRVFIQVEGYSGATAEVPPNRAARIVEKLMPAVEAAYKVYARTLGDAPPPPRRATPDEIAKAIDDTDARLERELKEGLEGKT